MFWTLHCYRPVNQGGALLIATWHDGEASRDIELAVCKQRQRRGELGRVIQHGPFDRRPSNALFNQLTPENGQVVL